jgi:AP-4 complex subunit beta-1
VKKGEIEELNEQLRKFINNRSDFEKTEVLKKIISSMTLGMDMSDLFNTIIMASRTPDLVQKKMIYLFLSQYAKENQEMTILAVNSILLDTKDSSPMIRGLALRWLCNMAYADARPSVS